MRRKRSAPFKLLGLGHMSILLAEGSRRQVHAGSKMQCDVLEASQRQKASGRYDILHLNGDSEPNIPRC